MEYICCKKYAGLVACACKVKMCCEFDASGDVTRPQCNRVLRKKILFIKVEAAPGSFVNRTPKSLRSFLFENLHKTTWANKLIQREF